MISSTALTEMLPIDPLKKLCQSIAMLDAILQPQWDLRYFSFDAHWDTNEMLASMRDGTGEGYFILFNEHGALIIGHSPHSPLGRRIERSVPLPGEFEQIPSELRYAINEPAFSAHPPAFCIWQMYSEGIWYSNRELQVIGNDPDGSSDLLFMLDGKPETYKSWAEEYFEVTIPVEMVQAIYQHRRLSSSILKKINPDRTMAELKDDLFEIGYP